MKYDKNQVPKPAEHLIWRQTDDGIVLVDPSGGDVRVLNSVGSAIWCLIGDDEPNSIEAIEMKIAERFGIDQSRAGKDLSNFLSELDERQLVSWS